MCQSATGLLAFTYAKSKDEASHYFYELFLHYGLARLEHSIVVWSCPDGWFLAGKEENYGELGEQAICIRGDDEVSIVPIALTRVMERLQKRKEIRDKRKRSRV